MPPFSFPAAQVSETLFAVKTPPLRQIGTPVGTMGGTSSSSFEFAVAINPLISPTLVRRVRLSKRLAIGADVGLTACVPPFGVWRGQTTKDWIWTT